MIPAALEKRRAVWLALSELYLDTHLTYQNYFKIKQQIQQAGCTLAEAKRIDRYEVFPVLYANLLSPAGVWSGFDESWLYENCEKYYRIKDKRLHQWKCEWLDLICWGTRKDIWANLST